MNPSLVLVKAISQKNNHTFTIEWSDGVVQDYRLSELQKRCCCAKCYDSVHNKTLIDPGSISDEVRATDISNVGRYAMRIRFTSGCSSGIYTFSMLRELANETNL